MTTPHPAHHGLPALYTATLGLYHGSWRIWVDDPDGQTGPTLTLDVPVVYEIADPDGPGRYLIEQEPASAPVPPIEAATTLLPKAGYVIAPTAARDPKTWAGWTQITREHWTAPCQPAAPGESCL
ncbi:hypothetical protein [Kitasatospora sp. NPDC001175]|uniref:hypothetical protein n=1 Tax=Kitasatospora sp. NPDC001175 TaxID=3157103 RepID=UPI003CFD1FE2